jgi:Rad3-related DNA helicase
VLKLLSPGLLLREISDECRTVILASGSLAPIPSLCAELNLFGKESSSSSSQTSSSQASSQYSKSNSEKKLASIFPSSQPSSLSQSPTNANNKKEKKYVDRLQTTPKPLEANHVVDLQKQLLAVSIGNFPDGEKLTVKYDNYKNPSFFPKLGHAISAVIESIPQGGCLIFFPSYSFLNKCITCWNPVGSERYSRFTETAPDVWARLLRSKGKIIVEPTRSQEEFEAARDEYKNTIIETGSCILLAVFRGKMSEGISFNDDNARAVLCIGMPYPNWHDRGVKAKQAYNDEQRKLRKKTCLLPGSEFYSQQAHRAIAQALGRCIRHGADYGTIVLMDSRHCDDGSPILNKDGICNAHRNLPKWMRGSVRTLSMRPNFGVGNAPILGGYGGLRKEMRQFFVQAPIVGQAVLDKWKIDLKNIKEKSTSSQGQQVFNRKTGAWTISTPNTQNQNSNNKKDKEEKKPVLKKGEIQI